MLPVCLTPLLGTPTPTDWMASHRPPNFTHLPHLPRLTDWGQRVGTGHLRPHPDFPNWPHRLPTSPLTPPTDLLAPLATRLATIAPPHTYRLDGHLWPQRGKGWRPIPGHPTGDRGPKRASKGLGGIG